MNASILVMLVLPIVISLGLVGPALAHTVDSVGPYRVEIGWMNEPVVSNETNAIELYVSPLKSGLELEEQIFENGVADLEDAIKLELLLKGEKIILPLSKDHNIVGKYYAFVNPTSSGFYQANVIGDIVDTPISLSMHPPKVNDRSYIEFPQPADITLTQMIEGHTALIASVHDLSESVDALEQSAQDSTVGYAGIGVGAIGIVAATIALARSRK